MGSPQGSNRPAFAGVRFRRCWSRVVLLFVILFSAQAPAPACVDARECSRQSAAAAAHGDFELAHDLAWRAVQKGRPNDPALMLVLARAQALSGRPGDALVMLGRLADLGAAPDVADDPDFRRVRALPGWAQLEAQLAGRPAPPSVIPTPSPAPPSSFRTSTASAPPSSAVPERSISSAGPAPVASAPSAAGETSLAFSAPGIEPFALVHDAVSRRFVLGDRRAHRLLVVDEVSRNVVNFVSAASAGFYEELTALALDTRRGDLWVASAQGDDDAEARTSIVHKLQLISGRTLLEVRAPDRSAPLRIAAIAVAPEGTVYALDSASGRLFRVPPGGRTLELVMTLDAAGGGALAAVDDRTLYVAAAKGLLRVDVGARTAAAVKSADDLGGFASLAWRGGTLLGVEHVAGSFLMVRVRLDASGMRAQPRQILAASPTPAVGALGGEGFYYLADAATIRRLSVR
jgi:hypothetical protein